MLQQVTLASLLPALLYLVCGLVIIRFVMSALSRALKRSAIDKTLHRFILTILRIVLYFVLFMTVAGALGIQITSFVALLSVAGLAISLSLQNVLSSASCGVMLLSVKPFKVGDYVEIGGVGGTVREIGFMHTKLAAPDNKIIYVPNNEVSTSKIINYTQEGKRRVDFVFTADYACPQEDVKRALREAVAKFPKVLDDPAPFIRVSGYRGRRIHRARLVQYRGLLGALLGHHRGRAGGIRGARRRNELPVPQRAAARRRRGKS